MRAKVLGLLVLAALTVGHTTSAQSPKPLELPYTWFVLDNGLHVILHEDHSVPLVSVNVRYRVGSANEELKRTGFAHLFEHLMFMGSGHVGPGQFDEWLENAGGNNNASTENDYTNYWIDVPSNALELALFVESDRMGYLLDTMTPQTVDAQRDVVKNERRQSYENRPYGMAGGVILNEMLYPEGHPYHWPVIGYMDDLTAASYEDVVGFFNKYYSTGNASLVIAGDIDPDKTRELVVKWFADVKLRPRPESKPIPDVSLTGINKKTVTDQVQLPRLYLAWLAPPAFSPNEPALGFVSDVLGSGRTSRLYQRLVYDLQIAQDVNTYLNSGHLSSQFVIVATARPGHTVQELMKAIDQEIVLLQEKGVSDHEVQRTFNQIEASFYRAMERVGGFGGKADQLNAYFIETGDPDWFNEDLSRFRAVSASDVKLAAKTYLPLDRRVELTVLPEAGGEQP